LDLPNFTASYLYYRPIATINGLVVKNVCSLLRHS
jgi:hypothetical protein